MSKRGYVPTDADGAIVKDPARFSWLRSEPDGSIVDVVNGTTIWNGSTQTLEVGSNTEVQNNGTTVEDTLKVLNAKNALSASSTGTDGEVELGVVESDISHDNLSNISSADHHPEKTPGTGLTEDANNNFNVQQEQIEDWVNSLLSASGNISLSYNDSNDNLGIDTSALNTEETQDAVNQLVASGTNLDWTYDDANDTLTIALSGPITGVQIGTSSNRSDGYFSTVDLGSLIDKTDGNAWETLRTAGYEVGDSVPVVSINSIETRQISFTDSTYKPHYSQWTADLKWDDLVPDVADLRVRYSSFINPGTDETVSTRITNSQTGNELVAITGITTKDSYTSGWVDYNPTNPSATENVRVEHKTDTGANSSRVDQPIVDFGVQL